MAILIRVDQSVIIFEHRQNMNTVQATEHHTLSTFAESMSEFSLLQQLQLRLTIFCPPDT